jgi:tetratricopeptide (TPR) repeat protein
MNSRPTTKLLVVAASMALLAACSSTPQPAADKPGVDLSVLMDQGATAERSGQRDVALRQYAEAARQYPASKQPWLKIAQMQFDAGNYGEAIVASQQVVSRDDRDKVAHSILSVSGLRVSSKAVSDLSRLNELTGSVRREAQDLAKVIRENLGERNLVPVSPPPAPRPAPAPIPSAARPAAAPAGAAPAAAPKAAGTPAAPAPAPSSGGGGSPFGVLK